MKVLSVCRDGIAREATCLWPELFYEAVCLAWEVMVENERFLCVQRHSDT